MTQQPTIGRTVLYTLTDDDARKINSARSFEDAIPDGVQQHFGNRVKTGDVVSMVITRVEGEYVNGQATLDGSDSFWVVRVREASNGGAPGGWHWPKLMWESATAPVKNNG